MSKRISGFTDAVTRRVILNVLHFMGSILACFMFVSRCRRYYYSQININLCFPELSARQVHRLTKASMWETGKLVFEALFFWLGSAKFYQRSICKVHGEEHLQRARATGRGVILISPHLGNWEVFNVYAGMHGAFVSYKPLEQNWLNCWIHYRRESCGSRMVALTAEGLKAMYGNLNQGGIVVLFPDQVPASGGRLLAPFFGVPAWTGTLVPKLAAKTNAVVLCGFANRLPGGRGFDIYLEPAPDEIYSADIECAAVAMNKGMEASIRHYPEQYTWEYKRFKHGIFENIYNKSEPPH